jgi:hypothetical protein
MGRPYRSRWPPATPHHRFDDVVTDEDAALSLLVDPETGCGVGL